MSCLFKCVIATFLLLIAFQKEREASQPIGQGLYYPPEVRREGIGDWEYSCCNTALLSMYA